MHNIITQDMPTLRSCLRKSSLQNKQLLLDQLNHLMKKMELSGYSLKLFDALITQEVYK